MRRTDAAFLGTVARPPGGAPRTPFRGRPAGAFNAAEVRTFRWPRTRTFGWPLAGQGSHRDHRFPPMSRHNASWRGLVSRPPNTRRHVDVHRGCQRTALCGSPDRKAGSGTSRQPAARDDTGCEGHPFPTPILIEFMAELRQEGSPRRSRKPGGAPFCDDEERET